MYSVCLTSHRSPERSSTTQKFTQGSLATPGVAKATPSCIQLVGFTALHTPGQPLAMNTGGGEAEREKAKTDVGSGAPDSLDSECTIETPIQSSSDGRWSSEATQRDLEEKPKVAVAPESSTELDLFGLKEVPQRQWGKYKSQLLTPVECVSLLPCTASELSGDPGQQSDHDQDLQIPRVYAVARRSSGKRMRCEATEDTSPSQDENSGVPQTLQNRAQSFCDFDSVVDNLPTFGSATKPPKPPLNIRTSKSDYQLHSRRNGSGKCAQLFEFGVSTPARIPTSVSHPCFPLSLPRNRLEGEDLKGKSPGGGDQEGDKNAHRFTFTFSNPRPVNEKHRAAMSTNNDHQNMPECEKEFESSRKVSECNEANLLDAQNSPVPNVTPQQPCSRNTSSIHSGQDLDEAFLLTPYPGMCRSPNLLEKISLEIAARHQLFPCTPHPLVENSLHVNDSYKQAVLGENYPFPLPEPLALRFETSDNAVKEEESFSDKENQGCSDDCRGPSILESDSSNCDIDNSHESQRSQVQNTSPVKLHVSCNQHRDITEAPRLQPHHPNLPPPPSSSDVSCNQHRDLTEAPRLQPHHPNLPPPPSSSDDQPKSRIVVSSKPHQKHEKHDSHWFGTPSASPRVFGFARKSPWFRGHGPTGQRLCK